MIANIIINITILMIVTLAQLLINYKSKFLKAQDIAEKLCKFTMMQEV